VIVLGFLVRRPLGGQAWHYLQYVLGLARLGHDVYYVEDSQMFEEEPSGWCYDPDGDRWIDDPSGGFDFTAKIFDHLGLAERWAFYDASAARWHGPAASRMPELCRTADLLLNVSAVNPLREWLVDVPIRVFVDTDPVFTQVRVLGNPWRIRLAQQHNVFVTFGENLPAGKSNVPDDGLTWRATRQPVVLEAWPVTAGPASGPFTTVMTWDPYSAEEHRGVRYGLKWESLSRYVDLPRLSGQRMEVAVLGTIPGPVDMREFGWSLREGGGPRDPWEYQAYIRESKGEFSVAKEGYVVGRSGWFSERSAVYMASGRPVVVQDTGFSDWMETGRGVLAFSTPEEAAAYLEEVSRDYDRHCRAARTIAEEYFSAGRVLSRLIETADDVVQRGTRERSSAGSRDRQSS
jgi:hypothetical protein